MSPKYQDIIPPHPERRSIRNIPLPERKQKRTSQKKGDASGPLVQHIPITNEASFEPHHDRHYEIPVEPAFYAGESGQYENSTPRRIRWAVVGIALIALVMVISTLFVHATITITGKTEEIALNATSFALATSESPQGIIYDTITLNAETSTTAAPHEKISSHTQGNSTSTQSESGTKASGSVIIYNNFSKNSQQLVENTRVETPEGLVYKTTLAVTVPGQKIEGGKTVPGSVTVNVVADQPGEKYNSGPKDFTIPGFKGTAKYTGFYARSKGALTGGSLIPVAVSSANTSSSGTVEDRLRADLKNQIVNQVVGQLPENFIYIPESIIITYGDPTTSPASDAKLTVTQKATATAIILDKQSLIKQLLLAHAAESRNGSQFEYKESQNISFDADISKISVVLPPPTTSATLKSGTARILLTGQVLVKPLFASEKVARVVSTLPKDQAISVIKAMDHVENVDVSISPFWKKTLPRADKVTVK